MWTWIRLGLLVLTASGGFAQTQPDAAEILKQVSETYKDVTQYELEFTGTAHDPDTSNEISADGRAFFNAPDKYRVEMTMHGLLGVDDLAVHKTLEVLIGLGNVGPIVRTAVPRVPRESRPENMDSLFGIGRFRHASELYRGARYSREESVDTGGGNKVDCFVIDASSTWTGATLWVDKNNHHVLRLADKESNAVYRAIRLNEPVPDGLFKFEVPSGAKKRENPQ